MGVSANGVSGQRAQLHAAMVLNHDHEHVMVSSILIVLVALIIKLHARKHHAQTTDGIITTVGILKNRHQLKLQLITTHGLIYLAEIIICLAVRTLETTSSNRIKATIYTKADNKITTLGNMFSVKS